MRITENLIQADNSRVWGQPNKFIGFGGGALHQRFSKYFTLEFGMKWTQFLGDLAGMDPNTYSGPRHSWTHTLNFVQRLGVPPFGSGLSPFQVANHLATYKVCLPPTCDEMALWIHQHPKLGAWKGLEALGFQLDSKDVRTTRIAFGAVYNHMDNFLTPQDKGDLSWGSGVIFTEHLLCKIVRWKGYAPTHFKLYEEADKWRAGVGDDKTAFPCCFPEEFLKELVARENKAMK